MSWDFQTEPEFQQVLDWADQFVRDEVEPLDYVVASAYDRDDPVRQALIPPLQGMVREHGLWATHLGPEHGGPGYGQVKLGLLNEILGADGPTEVHKMTVARELLRDMKPAESAFPSEHVPARRAAAMAKYADVLARVQAGG
ncbi:MAG TPA: hypothetical protein VGR98_24425 [Streptosporangiaceae bacterium]|nr:hypothetical protein [Streptosporangiaceae bacterium]